MSDKFETIARIPRNATMELLVKTGNYWKTEVVDVRWYSDGKPTKKGIRINMDELDTMLKALIKIKNKVNENESD
jgi:hypothetical protein|tara:strand:+ start:7453 stop:7677 length:225 start_codon:yes stop_codon:yes gene_type:complete